MHMLKRVIDDLRKGRNLDYYLLVLAGLAVIVLDLVGNVDPGLQSNVIIAALALIIFRMAVPNTAQAANLDDILQDRKGYERVPLREFLKGGKTVWIAAPSAVNIFRDATPLRDEVLDKNGEVVVLLQDPNQSEIVLKNLRDQLDEAAHNLLPDIHATTTMIDHLVKKGNKITCGFLPYSPGFSLMIVDPKKNSGKLVVEFFGFKNEFIGNRMHITITRRDSEYWFEYWVNQFEEMQRVAIAQQSSTAAAEKKIS